MASSKKSAAIKEYMSSFEDIKKNEIFASIVKSQHFFDDEEAKKHTWSYENMKKKIVPTWINAPAVLKNKPLEDFLNLRIDKVFW